jgi:phage gp29-like protein
MADNERRKRSRRSRRQRVSIRVGRELASPLRDPLTAVFGSLALNPDQTLLDHSGEGLRLYNEMLRKDAQLAMCFRQRALTVMAQGWSIIPGGGTREDLERAAWVREVLGEIRNFHLSRGRFFRGVSHGYAPAEIIFRSRPDGTLGIETFRNRDPERFRFDRENDLILVGCSGVRREKMPREKFVLNIWGSDETPYGQGLLQQLFPLWYFKSNAVKELVRFVEKFGAPYLWANYHRGTSAAEQDALMDVLKLMQGNSVGIGPEGTEISITEVGRQGVVEVFRFIIEEYVDRQYAKAVLGQTLSTESESGTFALARFQAKSQQHILEDDSLWHQEQLDGVIRTLIDLNFGPLPARSYPRFRIPYEEERDLQAYLQAVSLAVNELGLPVGRNWLREQIGIPAPPAGDSPLEGRAAKAGLNPEGGAGSPADGLD